MDAMVCWCHHQPAATWPASFSTLHSLSLSLPLVVVVANEEISLIVAGSENLLVGNLLNVKSGTTKSKPPPERPSQIDNM